MVFDTIANEAQRLLFENFSLFIALPHGKSFFVRFKSLFSSDSELVSPPRPQRRPSALEQERNMAYVKEKEEDVS